MTSPTRTESAPPAARLDPCLLGRPTHLLPRFGELLRDDLARALQQGPNRRWGASFGVGGVSFGRPGEADLSARWHAFDAPAGTIGVALDRRVLLAALGYRYGTPAPLPQDGQPEVHVRETATEERLAATLGQSWVGTLAARIDAGLRRAERDKGGDAGWRVRPGATPVEDAWIIRIGIEEPALAVSGTLAFALDEAWTARLMRSLAPARAGRAGRPRATPDTALAERLRITLVGQLVRKEMQLGEVLDLYPGAIVPISLGAADVVVGGSRLFTAAVAECKGKLCLTSFEDLE
jgi:flagellar motor switch protein FliM